MQHIESVHPEEEGESTTQLEKAQVSASKEEDEGQYVECLIEGCGEILVLDEMDYHLELHDQEIVNMDDVAQEHVSIKEQQNYAEQHESRAGPSSSRRQSSPGHGSHGAISSPGGSRQQHAISAWKNILNMPSASRRLTDVEKRSAVSAAPGKRLGVSPTS